MSTSDERSFAAAAGALPQFEAVARLANEFFKAIPGGESLTAPSAPPVAIPAAAIPTAAIPTAAIPTGGIPASATRGIAPSLSSFLPLAFAPVAPYVPDPGATLYVIEEAVRQARGPVPTAAAAAATATPRAITPGFDIVPSLVGQPALAGGIFDAASVRRDFPILNEVVHGKRLVWLDNAATTQKPQAVIDRLSHFYAHENSNVHRAAHAMAARATDAYEWGREQVRLFLNAGSSKDIAFVRGATEGINLVAQSWGKRHINAGDEIVLTTLEHHANIVPWQQLAAEKGARLRVAPIDDRGQIILEEYEKLFSPRTRLAAFAQVSNALGTITPVAEMIAIAHRYGARVLVDGAQAVSHMAVDVRALDTDFYVFSGHKVFGPTGIGAVYGKPEVFADSPPWQGGGNMIADVTFERTIYQPPPQRFEAGTGSIADAVGLGAALEYVRGLGLGNISRHEHELLLYATDRLCEIPGLRLIGTAADKASVLSFDLAGFKSEEVGQALDRDGIAVRSGHHCAQPALRRFGLETSVRPSLALYNTPDDVDALIDSLRRLTNGRQPYAFTAARRP